MFTILTASPPVVSKAPFRARRHDCLLACSLGVLLTAVTPAVAETVHLKDGTVLVGSRQREADGKVYFKSDLLGDLVIDAGSIGAPGVDVVQPGSGSAPGAAGNTPEATAAQPGAGNTPVAAGKDASAADKTVWAAKVSAGGTYTSATFKQGELVAGSGVTGASLKLPGRQLGAQISALVSRATPTHTLSFEGKFMYLDVQPIGRLAESYLGVLSALYHLDDTYHVVSRTSLFRDNVKHINYSFLQLVGVGRLLIDRPATKLELVPGLLLLVEGKGLATDGELLFGGGALEHFSHAFNPFVLIEQRLLVRTVFTNRDFTGIEGYAGFKGMLSRSLGVQAGVTLTYDRSLANLPLPMAPMPVFANETSQVMAMFGLEYTR